jgi:hypothetical protein
MNHEEMKSKMTDFIMSGPDDLTPQNVVENIRAMLEENMSLHEQNSMLLEKIESMKEKAEGLEKHLEQGNVMEKYKEYSRLKLKEQLLSVAANVDKLQKNHDVYNIPSIIKNIIECSPKSISSNSKIYSLILATVADKKRQLLQDFHSKFEAQLVRSEEFRQESVTWGPFLQSARGWIVAYTMVCILPSALRDMDQMVETYKDSLDSAFTPLWGRFHFHLTSARDSDSAEQILWTFEYSKTFISLLTGLCAHITHQQQGDDRSGVGIGSVYALARTEAFRMAGVHQIIEKAGKFLRAHVATSMGSSCWGSGFAVCLLESSLDLDHHLSEILTTHKQAAADITEAQPSTSPSQYELFTPVSSVFCDREDLRHLWLEFDSTYFRSAVLSASRSVTEVDSSLASQTDSNRGIFGFYFDSIDTCDVSSPHRLRCFKCVYDCLHLLRLACQRYRFLPMQTHDLFACRVIEPIILSALAMLFYRARTHPSLRELRQGRISGGAGAGQRGAKLDIPEVSEVQDCLHYMQRTLQHAESFLPPFRCPAQTMPARFERTWRHSLSWTEEVIKGGGQQAVAVGGEGLLCRLQPREVVEKIYSLCEKSFEKVKSQGALPVVGGREKGEAGLLNVRDASLIVLSNLQAEIEQDIKRALAASDKRSG